MENTYQYPVDSGGFTIFLVLYVVFVLALYAVTAAGLWKMYAKAGRPGWAAVVPIYNWWVWVDVIGRPRWWFWVVLAAFLLSWIPLVGIVLSIAAAVLYLLGCLDMARRFGRGAGTGVGLWILPFVFAPLLGFGSAQFEDGSPSQGDTAWMAGMGAMGRPATADPAPPSPLMTSQTPTFDLDAPAGGYAAAPSPATAATMDAPAVTMASRAPFDTPSGAPPAPTASNAPATPDLSATPPPVWPPSLDGSRAPYTLAPRTTPVPTLGSSPPAHAQS